MSNFSRTALCLGHPGHEIKVLAWAAKHKPMVTIFTDGSGPDRPSRLESTRSILEKIGCVPGRLFGNMPDREIYALMKTGAAPFVQIAKDLKKEWDLHQVDTVVGDAMEGYNTTHDVCRMIITAVAEKRARENRPMKNYAFPLDSLALPTPHGNSVVVKLDDAEFDWKKGVVKNAYPEMADDVDRIISKYGEAPFRVEIINPAPSGKEGMFWDQSEPPYYETYGRSQIEKGHYKELLTYRDHLQPVAEGLWQWAVSDD